MGRLWYVDSHGKRKRTKAGYKHAYEKWGGTEEAKKDRASQNAARRYAISRGMAHRGDNTSVDHKDSNPRNNAKSNLRVLSRSKNAGRKEDSRKKRSPRDKKNWGR